MIGVADALKGQVPRGFVVLKAGRRPATRQSCAPSWCSWCATRSAPSRRSRTSRSCPALPKTRSGKILRKTMRGIADGVDEPVPVARSTTPAVLDALRPVLRRG